MARPLRLQFPGAFYHVTARGNARQDIFLDDRDRETFLDFLAREIHQQAWKCHAYCLMTNHYHLLIETPEANLTRGMRRLNGRYAQTFNRRHDRVGHVLQGRYKSILVDKETYLLELCRYIVLNPVRAKVVRRPEDWAWSSYRATAGLRQAPGWLKGVDLRARFGRKRRDAQVMYRRFVAQGVGAASPWKELKGQIWLGSKPFLERMEGMLSNLALENVPATQTHPTRPDKDAILRSVAHRYGLPASDVLKRTCQPAFQAAIYLLRRTVNLSLKETAALAGVSTARVSQIQRRLDQRGADPRLQGLRRMYKVKN